MEGNCSEFISPNEVITSIKIFKILCISFVAFKGYHDKNLKTQIKDEQKILLDNITKIEEDYAEAINNRCFFDLNEIYSRIIELKKELESNKLFIAYLILKEHSIAFKLIEYEEGNDNAADLENHQIIHEIHLKTNALSKSEISKSSENYLKKIEDLEAKHKNEIRKLKKSHEVIIFKQLLIYFSDSIKIKRSFKLHYKFI